MLDSLLRRKFSAKCKQSVKCTKARILERRKKKQALLNFLKKDIADLLAIREDSIAFGRMDGLIVEMNHVACYDMIEKLCENITSQLPTLQKQRECSEEATEAVATLIYAAARFSDLPELCNLRQAFTKRYGGAMESSVNQEFREKISKKSFSKERKLKMMQEIANEFSVKWDYKDFGQKKQAPATPPLQPETDAAGRFDVPATSKNSQPVVGIARKEAQPVTTEARVILNSSHGVPVIAVKKVELDHGQDVKEHRGPSPRGLNAPVVSAKSPPADNPTNRAVGQQPISRRAINPSPPYVRANEPKNGARGDEDDHATASEKKDAETIEPERVIRSNIIPPDVKKPVKAADLDDANPPSNRTPPYLKPIAGKVEHEESVVEELVKEEEVEKPKPRSMRRNKQSIINSNQHQAEVEVMDADERIDQIVYGRRRGGRRGTRSYDADRDDEDKAIDRLLLHYSSKDKPARDVKITEPKLVGREPALTRVASLPPERTDTGNANVPRASPLIGGGARVHPRLPDYDELAARFNALKKS